ncbi:MAG TPA: glycerate kinase [Candidatus Thermoplasmatota archaeon]|nr:glycerate kinase [Candidatus Thermoplasmatota archaeon]
MRLKNGDELVANGATKDLRKKRKDALEILTAAVEAVDPYQVVAEVFQKEHLLLGAETVDLSKFDHVYVIGFGKSSVPMARAVCDAIPVSRGVVITNDSSATMPCKDVEVVAGGHPLPDEGSIRGTEKILSLLEQCGTRDCVIMVISGGGSSLLCKPLVPLEDLRVTIELIQNSGADIHELNAVRKHLSQVKGGKLVQYTNASVFTLILSDVVHDSLSAIASGPASPDPTTFSDAKAVLFRYRLWDRVPGSVRGIIEAGIAGSVPETLKEGDPCFRSVRTLVVASNQLACDHAVKKAKALGYTPVLLSTTLTGEARAVGRDLILKARHYHAGKNIALISGGETTVTIRGDGVGGRNQELVLSCVSEIEGTRLVVASLGTDGVDGNSNAAGAIADGATLSRAREERLEPSLFLQKNDSNTFFSLLHDAILTGSTGTNVMDIQVVLS